MAFRRQLGDWLSGDRLRLRRARQVTWGALGAALFNWAVVLAGLVMAQGLGAIVVIVVARRVVPINFGQYLACFSLMSLLVVVPTLGLDNWLLAQGDPDEAVISRYWRQALRSRLWSLLVWLLAVAALGLVLPKATYPITLLVPVAVGVGADSVENLCYSGLRLVGQHRWITTLQSALAVASLLLALLLPLVSQPILVFAVGRAILSLIAAVAAVVLTRRLLRSPGQAPMAGGLERRARPFFIADVAILVYSRVSLTVISLLVGAAATAAFGTADNFINLSFWVPTALYLLVLPRMARAQATQRRSTFTRLGIAQMIGQTLIGLAESAAIFLLAPLLVRLVYGSPYSAAIPILQWFSPIPFFKALNFGVGAWLTAGGNQAGRTTVQIILAVFTVAAALIAIGGWGVAGGAVVEVASEVLLFAGYSAVLVRMLRRERSGVPQAS